MEPKEIQPFLDGYYAQPNPGRVPELFALLEQNRALDQMGYIGPAAGLVLALFEKHPEHELDWARFSGLRPIAEDRLAFLRENDRAGLNDYLMARWFVLHDEAAVLELIKRQDIPGGIGESASWALESVANRDPAMASFLERLQAEGFVRS